MGFGAGVAAADGDGDGDADATTAMYKHSNEQLNTRLLLYHHGPLC